MSKSTLIYKIPITIGQVQYFVNLSLKGEVYTYTISRITGHSKKRGYKLKEIHSTEYYFKPNKKQARNAALLIAAPDAKIHQPEPEEQTEEPSVKSELKPLLT